MKTIREKKEALELQMEKIKAQIEVLEQLLNPEAEDVNSRQAGKPKRIPIKNHVLRYLSDAGAQGITATEVMDKFEADGIEAERASVSSLLSRLKSQDTLRYINDRYVLTELVEVPRKMPPVPPVPPAPTGDDDRKVHLHPASRSFP